jgi:hypothetical protein
MAPKLSQFPFFKKGPLGRPASGGYAGGYAWGYAGGYRIPQLYPPARMKIPTQIQNASRLLAGQNQPRLAARAPNFPLRADFIFRRFNVPSQIATHHHGFQPDGCCRFVGGLLRGQSWLCILVTARGCRRQAAKGEVREANNAARPRDQFQSIRFFGDILASGRGGVNLLQG